MLFMSSAPGKREEARKKAKRKKKRGGWRKKRKRIKSTHLTQHRYKNTRTPTLGSPVKNLSVASPLTLQAHMSLSTQMEGQAEPSPDGIICRSWEPQVTHYCIHLIHA